MVGTAPRERVTPSVRSRVGDLDIAVRCAAAGVLVVAGWAAVLWISQQLTVTGPARDLALFAHLVSLVAGMGAVLTVDWAGLQWLRGRRSLADVLELTSTAHVLIWLGLAGLVASGAFLSPDLTAVATLTKLGTVLLVALNGVQAHALLHRLQECLEPGPALLRRIAASATVSQACWWTALVIGYLNSRS